MTHPQIMLMAPAPQAPKPAVVLVVEDDDMVRLMTVDFLESCGYLVLEAENAARAMAWFGRQAIDLMFTDVQMPGAMDGIALAEWVRANHPAVPVLVTSGVASELARYAAGLMVAKPYDLDAVHARIQAALGQR
ncbi:MAG: response regulator [Ferrovibrio sp.]|uniref:response regulator n=1 Tax=Ferrovibrio sp. TaxID=1917215 RepID=UPI00261091CC|nr:response regulator [Ferrovibrio sp.]MCW0235413.1 response regulator [Ferrovibrio sp.]